MVIILFKQPLLGLVVHMVHRYGYIRTDFHDQQVNHLSQIGKRGRRGLKVWGYGYGENITMVQLVMGYGYGEGTTMVQSHQSWS